MSKPAWLVVARREISEGARSRWFLVTTILGPLLLGGVIALSAALQLRGAGKTVRVALVDPSEGAALAPSIAKKLESVQMAGRPHFKVEIAKDGDAKELRARIDRDDLDGYVVLPRDVTSDAPIVYRGTDASSTIDMALLERSLQAAVIDARARARGMNDADVKALLAPIDFDARLPSEGGEEASGSGAFVVAYTVAFLLYVGILIYAVGVMRSVLQEKSSRVMEVIVATARPGHLMLGKVLGMGMLGLFQMGVWLAGGALVAHFKGPMLGAAGVPDAGAVALPTVGPFAIATLLLYFLGGYFLYAACYAAIGAAHASDREAQQAQLPIVLLLMTASVCFPVVTAAPRDLPAIVLTTIPFFSPMLMPMRVLLAPVPAWQLLLSIGLLAATTIGMLWIAARIYRVGALMYGKRPTLAEIVRWIREP